VISPILPAGGSLLNPLAHKSPVHTCVLVLRVTYPQVIHNMWGLSPLEVKMYRLVKVGRRSGEGFRGEGCSQEC
jgi:hypothetical protein